MSRYEIYLLPEAEDDARNVYLGIFKDSPKSAGEFAETLEAAIAELAETAHTWDAKHELKRYFINHYRVTLIYRLRGDRVTIGAVAHQRRKPGYWAGRKF